MKGPIRFQSSHPGFWSGALFGAVTGMTTLLLYQFLSGILRQPRLLPWTIISHPSEFETQEALALFIASESMSAGVQTRRLQNGKHKEVLHAGYRNFRESWARDFGFASYGLLALEQYDVVRQTLEAFFWYQTPTGQLPVKLHSMDFVTRYFHSFLGREQSTEGTLRPKYISAHGAPSLDGQGLLMISAITYARKTKNIDFLKGYWTPLVSALNWLEAHKRNPDDILLHQQSFADWADSVARRGYVHYTNVVYWKALSEMALAAQDMDMKAPAVFYKQSADHVAQAIRWRFWRDDLGYFITSDTLHQLSSDGNLLAAAWGLANAEESQSILRVMDEAGMSQPVPTRVTSTPYPSELIAIENVLAGVGNYHTDAAWLWLGAWHVIAWAHCGDLARAQEILSQITAVIVRNKQIHEVYGTNGQPLASIWYKPEAPLTWSAGMFIYACRFFEEATANASKHGHAKT